MSTLALVLGGISIPVIAGLDLQQSYEAIGGWSVRRMMSGAAVRQTHWERLRTRITGTGWLPEGLHLLDYAAALTLDCIAPRSVVSATNTATLPSARRPDASVYAYALTALDGHHVQTGVVVIGDAATADAVAGAVQYRFVYVPRLQVFAAAPSSEFDRDRGEWRWSLEAEEI